MPVLEVQSQGERSPLSAAAVTANAGAVTLNAAAVTPNAS